MRIVILAGYYYPESVGAGVWLRQLASDLRQAGNRVTVITSFPSYPTGRIFASYRGQHHLRETIDGVDVIRTLTYATPSKRFWPRVVSFGTWCASALAGGLVELPPADVVYAVLPPLPLGLSAWALARGLRARLVVNIQDIYPDAAVAAGVLRSPAAISLFGAMERFIYRRADRVVVISEGFRQNLLAKGVPADKMAVVPNWADADAFPPAGGETAFRREVGALGKALILYSGGLTHNSCLEPVIEAAHQLRDAPFSFAIVGDGVKRKELEHRASDLRLNNVRFLPFQPLERYPEVLGAADVTLVTLRSACSYSSVPSKIYKQMAAGRPIIAITENGNELTRLIETSRCGVAVAPGDVPALVHAMEDSAQNRQAWEAMGRNGRRYLETECARGPCVRRIESILRESVEGFADGC